MGLEHLLTEGILNWALRGRDPAAQTDPLTGRCSLMCGARYKTIVCLFFAISTLFPILGVLISRELTGPGLLLVATICGAMWLAGLYAAYDTFLVDLSFGPDGLTRKTIPGHGAYMPWSRITAIEYSTIGNWFTFRSPDCRPIRISIYRNGLGAFAEVAGVGMKSSTLGHSSYLLVEKARNPG
jgi:hypothetical protein